MFIDEIQDVLKLSDADMCSMLGLASKNTVTTWKIGKPISSNYKKKLNILYSSIQDFEEVEIVKRIMKNKNAIAILGSILFVGTLMEDQQEETIESTTTSNGKIVLEKKTIITPATIKTILASEQMRALKVIISLSNKK